MERSVALTMVDAAISAYWPLVEEASVHVQMEWNYYLEIRTAVMVMGDVFFNILFYFLLLQCSNNYN